MKSGWAPFCRVHVAELAEEPIAEKNAGPAVIEKELWKRGKGHSGRRAETGAALVALCVEGRQLSSEALARRLAEWAVSGVSCAAFAIGSSHGLSPQVKQAAALRLSMSENDLSPPACTRDVAGAVIPRVLYQCRHTVS